MSSTGGAPKKYIRIDGVMKMNPAYKAWKDNQNPRVYGSASP